MSEWALVGQGGVTDIGSLSAYENAIPEGSTFQVRLALRTTVAQSIVNEVKSQMIAHGIADADASASGKTMTITGRKGFPWLAVIAAIILAILVLVIIIVSWSIFKKVVPAGLQGTIVTLLIVGAIVLSWVSAEKKSKGAYHNV